MEPARRETLARVAARVREEVARADAAVQALRQALDRWGPGPQDPINVHWVGGLVHDLYTGIEKAFSEISPELNGADAPGERWHRSLLHTMTLELPDFRPRVIRRELEPPLLELLKFRHLYRNLYSFELRWERVRTLASEAVDLWPKVAHDLRAFASALDTLARA